MESIKIIFSSLRRRGWTLTFLYIFYEFLFDFIRGVDTTPIHDVDQGRWSEKREYAASCQSANPLVVNRCFKVLSKLLDDFGSKFFVDLGSGKGRVLILALESGFEHVVGVEINEAASKIAMSNLICVQRTNQYFNIVNLSVECYAWEADADVVFMYNPFGYSLVKSVGERLLARKERGGKGAYVIYVNPVCANAFSDLKIRIVAEIADEALIYKI